jgi:hypothetical protein
MDINDETYLENRDRRPIGDPINAPYPESDCLECEPGAEPCPAHNARLQGHQHSCPWAVCAVDEAGNATHFTTESESEATAWAIHRLADYPSDRIVCQHGIHSPIFALQEDETWVRVLVTPEGQPYLYNSIHKVSSMYRGTGGVWHFVDRTQAVAFAMSQRDLSSRNEVLLTGPDGKVWQVDKIGRLSEKKPDLWRTTTTSPEFDEPFTSEWNDPSLALASMIDDQRDNPRWRIVVTDPAGTRRELKLVPQWVHVDPEPRCCTGDPFCDCPDTEAQQNYYRYGHVFEDSSH